tara:strand:+ start:524 stop:757 length:234 start_codon:yes stop_codon:yes gene_type:complete
MKYLPPGAMLRVWIRENGKVAILARELGVSRQAVHQWMREEGSLPAVAHRLDIERITGIPCGLWSAEEIRRAAMVSA